MIRVVRIAPKTARVCLPYLKTHAPKASTLDVCNKIEEWLGFLDMGIVEDQDVIFAAFNDKEDGSPAACIGLITASRHSNNGVWYINDLATLGGCGRLLTDRVIAHAAANQRAVAASFVIDLFSLDADSTSFWKHLGFVALRGIGIWPLPMRREIAIASGATIGSVSTSSSDLKTDAK